MSMDYMLYTRWDVHASVLMFFIFGNLLCLLAITRVDVCIMLKLHAATGNG